jgi:DNA end-binding protein Ku
VARPVWTGSISFGLVNVPVKAYTAVRDHDAHFHQLEKGSGARIRYRKVSERTGREVDADDVELGYEVEKGHYVTFARDELDRLRPESTRMVEVTDFVDLAAVDPIFYGTTYWLAPDGDAGTQAYQLLRAAMEQREKVAVGTVVMRDRQRLAAIRPLDGALALSTMRFADEVVGRGELDAIPDRRRKPEGKALTLATQIIDSLAADWKPEQYRDTYTDELRARIAAKDREDTGGEGGSEAAEEGPEPSRNVVDLMAALERSVEQARKGARRGSTSRTAAKHPKSNAGRSKTGTSKAGTSQGSPSKAGGSRRGTRRSA